MYQRLAQAVNSQQAFGKSPYYCQPWTGNYSVVLNTVPIMAGMGWTSGLQATKTGRQMLMLTGWINLSGASGSQIMGIALRYGTGTPPARGANAIGTQLDGGSVDFTVATFNQSVLDSPFLLCGVLPNPGLVSNIWFDICIDNTRSGTTPFFLGWGTLTIYDV